MRAAHTSYLLCLASFSAQRTIKTDCGKRVPMRAVIGDQPATCADCAHENALLFDAAQATGRFNPSTGREIASEPRQ